MVLMLVACHTPPILSEHGQIELEPMALHRGHLEPHVTGGWLLDRTLVCIDAETMAEDCWWRGSEGLEWLETHCFRLDNPDQGSLVYTVRDDCLLADAVDDRITFVQADPDHVTAEIHDFWAELAGEINAHERELRPLGGEPLDATLGLQPDPIRVIRDGTAVAYVRLVHDDGSGVAWDSRTQIDVSGAAEIWDPGGAGIAWQPDAHRGQIIAADRYVRDWVRVPASDARRLVIQGFETRLDPDQDLWFPWVLRAVVLDRQGRPLQGADVEWSTRAQDPIRVAPFQEPQGWVDRQQVRVHERGCFHPDADGLVQAKVTATYGRLRTTQKLEWRARRDDAGSPSCPEPECGCSAVQPGSAALAGLLGALVLVVRRGRAGAARRS